MSLLLERRSNGLNDPEFGPLTVYESADCVASSFVLPDGFAVTVEQAVQLARPSAFLPVTQRPYSLRIIFQKPF